MRAIPAADDYDGWVRQLAVSHRRQQAKRHLRAAGPPAVPALRRGLAHPEAIVRRLCVNILDVLVDEASIPALTAALDDEDTQVRVRALHALACEPCKQNACRPGDDLWVPRALELLRDDPDPDIRAAAINALGRAASRRADVGEALATAAEDDRDQRLRSMALQRVR